MSDEPKCWWRYNNNGGRYMTCNFNQKEPSGKPPPKPIPRMTTRRVCIKNWKRLWCYVKSTEKRIS
jgi:hypothetical protein